MLLEILKAQQKMLKIVKGFIYCAFSIDDIDTKLN